MKRLSLWLLAACAGFAPALAAQERVALYGRGSSPLVVAKGLQNLGFETLALTEENFDPDTLGGCRLVVLLSLPRSLDEAGIERWSAAIALGQKLNQKLRVVASGGRRGGASRLFPDLVQFGLLEVDAQVSAYAGARSSSTKNLESLSRYLAKTYLGRSELKVPEPEELITRGLYHPDHAKLFQSVESLANWAKSRGIATDTAPRVLVTTTFVHLQRMNRAAVDALIRAAEKRGAFAAAVIQREGPHVELTRAFAPDALIHTFRSRSSAEEREALDAPHMFAAWLRRGSLEDWLESPGRTSDFSGLLVEESAGTIEPFFVSARLAEDVRRGDLRAIQDRVDRVVGRALGWSRLRRTQPKGRKIAMLYGAATGNAGGVTLGTADARELDLPTSLVVLLQRLQREGYDVRDIPRHGDALIESIIERGMSVAHLSREEHAAKLDRIAMSGDAELLPVESYRRWYEANVPESRRAELEERFGPVPGELGLGRDSAGRLCYVIPRLRFGNVTLVPKALHAPPSGLAARARLRGKEAESDRTCPSHAYLAQHAWLQQELQPHAVVTWGSFGIDLLLPEKKAGLRASDWPDILAGETPAIRPWAAQALHFSMLARRRCYSVTPTHAGPPLQPSELSDELELLQSELRKWPHLEDGALRESFRERITQICTEQHLHEDLDIDLEGREHPLLSDEEVAELAAHLERLGATPVAMGKHVLGRTPAKDRLLPYLMSCLPPEFERDLEQELAKRPGTAAAAERLVALAAWDGLDDAEALAAAGITFEGDTPQSITDGLGLARKLLAGYRGMDQELTGLLDALNGGFVTPGPGGQPHQNPSMLPTGRNLYVLHPDEIPSPASFALGKKLVTELLAERAKKPGKDGRIAFVLSPRSTLRDFGVAESQVLWAIGVEPIWDRSGQVHEFRIVPREELDRPRADVVLQVSGFYLEHFDSRLKLLDAAIRAVAELESEADNQIAKNAAEDEQRAIASGTPKEHARLLAVARIFSSDPGRFASGTHDKFFEATDLWKERSELNELWLDRHGYAYTEGLWGKRATSAHRQRLSGADLVLRPMNKRGALRGRAHHDGGSLSMAIEHLSGHRPGFLLSDLRRPGREELITAKKALRMDTRNTLLNRKWIEQTMREGYAGAAEIAKLSEKLLGWSTSRPGDVGADLYESVYRTHVQDRLQLGLEAWFDKHNPFARRELAEALLEATRKEFWDAPEELRRELAGLIRDSEERFGPSGGAPNVPLERLVDDLLGNSAETVSAAEASSARPESSSVDTATVTESVRGQVLEPSGEDEHAPPASRTWLLVLAGAMVLAVGVLRGTGAARP